jgi:hypothetical protein
MTGGPHPSTAAGGGGQSGPRWVESYAGLRPVVQRRPGERAEGAWVDFKQRAELG